MKVLKLLVGSLILVFFVSTVFAQKMKSEDILAKHLESIGTAETRAAVKNQLAVFEVQLVIKGNANTIKGKALILSDTNKTLWGMNFNSNDYPQDRFGFNGNEVKVGYIRPGIRSQLGGFIYSYKEILKEGLLGGTFSSSWNLLNTDNKKAKISYDGNKKIGSQDTYVLSFSPKTGSDLTIKMYFDTKTFRHVRTEYSRVVSARQGNSIDTSAAQGSDFYKLTEDFSDFASLSGITVPKTYKISYSTNNNSTVRTSAISNQELEWRFNLTNFSINQELDKNSFDIDAK